MKTSFQSNRSREQFCNIFSIIMFEMTWTNCICRLPDPLLRVWCCCFYGSLELICKGFCYDEIMHAYLECLLFTDQGCYFNNTSEFQSSIVWRIVYRLDSLVCRKRVKADLPPFSSLQDIFHSYAGKCFGLEKKSFYTQTYNKPLWSNFLYYSWYLGSDSNS